ncbi:beta-microseminoprotein isoform X2 [Psammomys obesus]|uniref:beta-microseminoprotein isoform X2 n=1 Tax=Psammomys obesus TaxID=48139 RepID=UPI002452D048|nr:beta-microseminoprotein isoform X2 [Psammomys obesus]
MKARLGSLLLLATLVTACNAGCFFENRQGPPSECVDADGEKHPLFSFWVKNCNRCYCEEKSVHCCNQIPIPVSYDKQKCREEFHKETCTYRVVERDNPVKACAVEGWIM